jgi:hypothetical protein
VLLGLTKVEIATSVVVIAVTVAEAAITDAVVMVVAHDAVATTEVHAETVN